MIKHIILVGFMGSGKTTLGLRLAKHTHCSFIDTDQYIEEKEGRKISEIFETDGEQYFRMLETNVLEELLNSGEKYILSLGGGTPLREENRKLIKKGGYCIFLKVTAKEAYERLKGDSERPLLQVPNPKDKIHQLLKERNPIYESVADYVLDEEGKNVKLVFDELLKVVREK